MKLQQLESIRFFDIEKQQIISARYQATDEHGILIRRLDDFDIQYIDEKDIVDCSMIEKEFKTFSKSFDLKEIYKSYKDYFSKLQEETKEFLKNKAIIRLEILEKNWCTVFEDLELVHAYMIKDEINKWGNSAAICLNKKEITESILVDLTKIFKIHDIDKYSMRIYSICLALEIISNRKIN